MITNLTRPARITLTIVALALAGVLHAQAAPPPPIELTDDPDAVVIAFADTEVTLAEFAAAFDRAARGTAIGQGMPVTDEVLAEFEPFKGAFLDQYARQLVLAHEAAERGLAATDAEIDSVVEALRAEQADEAAFDAWLDAAGYGDTDTLRDTVGSSLAAQSLIDDLATGVSLEPDAARDWYDANPQAVTTEDGERIPFDAVEPQIAQLLVEQAVDAQVELLVAQVGLEVYPQGR